MRKSFAMIFFWILFFIFILTKGCNSPETKQTGPKASDPPASHEKQPETMLDLHNKERILKGLSPLTTNEKMQDYAKKHAEKMAKEKSMRHSSMRELSELSKSNLVAENIAYGYDTEKEVIKSWMNSPGHKRNILGGYSEMGFGSAKDDKGTIYYCVVFASKQKPIKKMKESN